MRLFPSGVVARRRREGTDPVSSLHRHRIAVPRNFGLRHRSPYCPRVSVLGATLAWVGRKHEKLVAVQQEIAEAGGNASIHICDIREEDQVRATVEAILKACGRIDYLVNNPGGQFSRRWKRSAPRVGTRWCATTSPAVFCLRANATRVG